jgi:multidrug efflux pump subunit AcrA (membrane-fusion protein)
MEFRHRALENLRAPEDLDEAVRFARPGGWVVLSVLAAVVLSCCIWAFGGHLPRQVAAPGVLTHPEGVSSVQSTLTGLVSAIMVEPGSSLRTGTPILAITNDTSSVQFVRLPFTGRVIGTLVQVGQYVTAGTSLATIERTDDPHDRLLAVLFVPAGTAGSLRPGYDVDLTVSSAPSQAFGVLRGVIRSVDQFTESQAQIADFLGDQTMAAKFTAAGTPVKVTVDLTVDESTLSGFKWSTPAGPPYRVDSQIAVSGAVHLPSKHPVEWIVPG